MPDLDTVRSWEARTMVDRDGTRIGPIQAIYLDDRTGQPEWALVTTGLFGTKASFVPWPRPPRPTATSGSPRQAAGQRRPPDRPRPAPVRGPGEQLWRHYDLDYDRPTRRRATGRDTGGRDASGPTTDDAMTRSEEELRVGTTSRERGSGWQATCDHRAGPADRAGPAGAGPGGARQSPTPTRRGHLRPGDLRGGARGGPAGGGAGGREAGRPERVRLDKDTVTDQEQVTEQLRKEQIDLQGEDGKAGGRAAPASIDDWSNGPR